MEISAGKYQGKLLIALKLGQNMVIIAEYRKLHLFRYIFGQYACGGPRIQNQDIPLLNHTRRKPGDSVLFIKIADLLRRVQIFVVLPRCRLRSLIFVKQTVFFQIINITADGHLRDLKTVRQLLD